MNILTRLVYCSTATNSCKAEDIHFLLQSAQKNNPRHGITGFLAFDGKFFLQALEGSREKISQLCMNLMHDKRHHSVILSSFKSVDFRLWEDWSMGFANPTSNSSEFFLKHTKIPIFNPYDITAETAENLLKALTSASEARVPL